MLANPPTSLAPAPARPLSDHAGRTPRAARSSAASSGARSDRIQILLEAARILAEESQTELRALSLCLTPDQFCDACCALQKQLAPINQFLLAAQLAIRLGQKL